LLSSVTIPNSVTSIDQDAFEECDSLTSVYIYDLSAWCKIDFANHSANPLCHGAKLYINGVEQFDISIPSGVTKIKYFAFYGYASLTSVTIGNNVTSIGYEAFRCCSSLSSITIGDSVTEIGSQAFEYCSNLTNVTIGRAVTEIREYAFCDCSNLKTIVCKAEKPPRLVGYTSISDFFSKFDTLIIPEGSEDAYLKSKWGKYIVDEC
jgi:hypothetical protein